MKTLKFHPSLVPKVLSGKKVTTWRLFDDKNLTEGDEIMFLNSETKQEFIKAVLTHVKETTFSNLTEDDWKGHEKFSSDEEMYSAYSRYYNGPINENTELKIIRYELIK